MVLFTVGSGCWDSLKEKVSSKTHMATCTKDNSMILWRMALVCSLIKKALYMWEASSSIGNMVKGRKSGLMGHVMTATTRKERDMVMENMCVLNLNKPIKENGAKG